MGQREEFELMIQRAKHVVPALQAIEVASGEAEDGIPPGAIFWTQRDDVSLDNDPASQNWIEWMAATFPPGVCPNFVLLPVYRASEG
jgi:hypothetical protein